MIYLASFSRKSKIPQLHRKSKGLLFIEAEDRLALDKVIALVKKLTAGDFDESSVEIIGESLGPRKRKTSEDQVLQAGLKTRRPPEILGECLQKT